MSASGGAAAAAAAAEQQVNGIAIPEQFAIYANHQPGACANAKFHW
eukprot:COSAG01_NODE_32738_length_576_cov_1.008386_1_plen_45_part_01